MNWLSSLIFTHATLAPFLVLIGVPLILHLFARARPPVDRFSSIEFIRRIVRKTIRIRKPREWLILFLRTVLFAALIGLFLQPVFYGMGRLAPRFQSKHVVVLIDASASMACMEGSQTRFAAACAKASEVLASLSASDRANLIWMRTPNRAEFPSLGANVAYLQSLLRKATVSAEAADLRGAFEMAANLLKDPTAAREIHVISDFQKSAWSGFRPAVPDGIRLVSFRVGHDDVPNQALTRLYARPARPLLGEEVSVYAEVENFAPQPVLKTVYLRAGESRQEREVRLAPWQKGVVMFRCRLDTPGETVLAASLSEDAFPLDNERWALVDVQEYLSVGLLAHEPRTAACWRKALDAVGWARVKTVNRASLNESLNFDALLLSGWDGDGMERVGEFLKNGGLVVWFPTDRTPRGAVRTLAAGGAGAGAAADAPIVWQKSREALHLKITRANEPVFEIFGGGAHGDPTRGNFFGRFDLAAKDFPNGETILAYPDDGPALLRINCGGCLLLWNLALQPEFSNWAGQSEFLPFFIELLLKNRSVPRAPAPVEFAPGQVIARTLDCEVLDRDIQLFAGDTAVRIQRQPDLSRVVFAATDTARLGVYRWLYRSQLLGHHLVNFPSIESDLRLQSTDELQSLQSLAVADGRTVRSLREGTPLWPGLLGLAVVLALVEGALLLRTERT